MSYLSQILSVWHGICLRICHVSCHLFQVSVSMSCYLLAKLAGGILSLPGLADGWG